MPGRQRERTWVQIWDRGCPVEDHSQLVSAMTCYGRELGNIHPDCEHGIQCGDQSISTVGSIESHVCGSNSWFLKSIGERDQRSLSQSLSGIDRGLVDPHPIIAHKRRRFIDSAAPPHPRCIGDRFFTRDITREATSGISDGSYRQLLSIGKSRLIRVKLAGIASANLVRYSS